MLQPSLCLRMARVEGECFFVIGDGSFFHAFLLAFLAHDDILRGKALEEFLLLLFLLILLLDYLPQPLVLGLQLIHLVKLLADEALGKRMLDVVTAVDGEEEIIRAACISPLSNAFTASWY